MRTVSGFNVDVRRDGSTVVVAPSGELDLATVGQLRDAMGRADGCAVLVLDLRGLTFMDSAGLSLVVEEHRRAADVGIEFRVVRGSREVQRLFELTGLADRLEFTKTEQNPAANGGPPDL
ncbi:MAG TPA: STAS domain-containing protein [Solirubrobacteraceae bacterium]